MSSVNIYEILSSKPHNPHYLKRYISFIEHYLKNPTYEYAEIHHICPKASDLFPEYANLNEYPWNKVRLSAAQHIVAHVLLWKAFSGSQAQALECMLGQFNANTNEYLSRRIPTKQSLKYLAKAREDASKYRSVHHIGKSAYKDSLGNIFYLNVDDPLIEELGLVGATYGRIHDAETKERMSNAKLPNREVTMTFLDLTRRIKLFSEDYDAHIAQGWKPLLPRGTSNRYRMYEEDVLYRRDITSQQKSIDSKGTTNYWWPDGTPYGVRLKPDDPLIEELGLIIVTTDAKIEAARRNSKMANEANTGTQWYNNGVKNKKFRSDPGGEWVLGQKPYEPGVLDYRKQRSSESNSGTKTYNDGIRNYRVKEGDYIDPTWKPGMAPQKPRKSSQVPGSKIYNDGTRNIRVNPGDCIDPSWTPGMIKGVKKTLRYTNGIDLIIIKSGDRIPDGYRKATKAEIEELSVD